MFNIQKRIFGRTFPQRRQSELALESEVTEKGQGHEQEVCLYLRSAHELTTALALTLEEAGRTLGQKARREVRASRERAGPLRRNSHPTKPFLTHLVSRDPDKAGSVIPRHWKLSFRQFVLYPRSHRMADLGFKARCVKPWFSTATLYYTLHYILEVIKPSPDVA